MDEEFKINKMPTIKNKKDVKQLFEPGNFLYNLIYECNDHKTEINSFKDKITSEWGLKQSAQLEDKYQLYSNKNGDWYIHDNCYTRKCYSLLRFPFNKKNTEHQNDVITSNIKETDSTWATSNRKFKAVKHTIGNMITATNNWSGGKGDYIWIKMEYLRDIVEHPKKAQTKYNEKISKAYMNYYKNDYKKLLRSLYLVDAWDFDKNCPKMCLAWGKRGTVEANTKFIIQRGYRMQKKYKEPEFTSDQQGELQAIFDYFEFKDKTII